VQKAVRQEVKYDMQMLADKIEFYWTHLSGIGTLENSLWGWDGKRIRVWLNALTIETIKVDPHRDAYEYVEESLAIGLDFYPLCELVYIAWSEVPSECSQLLSFFLHLAVLMDKGIIVGIDHETSLRKSLDFAIFRIITNVSHVHWIPSSPAVLSIWNSGRRDRPTCSCTTSYDTTSRNPR
jgi:hypothetical protein